MTHEEREYAITTLDEAVSKLPEIPPDLWCLVLKPDRREMSKAVQACHAALEVLPESARGEIMSWPDWGRRLTGAGDVRVYLADLRDWLAGGRKVH